MMNADIPRAPRRMAGASVRAMTRTTPAWLPADTHDFVPLRFENPQPFHQLSRVVEQEWQRNCVRHRDFITPGFLTVRFFVEPTGKVRTVQFVGTMETGEVQKGFTLSAIRDAAIPAMPAAVKKDFDKEPLELIFNFYF